MKKRIILFLALALLPALPSLGQTARRINEIKKNYNYLWSEATMETAAAAYQVANEYLQQKVKEYAAEKKIDGDYLIIKNMSSKCDTIHQPRGDMVKVFMYIKKVDIAPAAVVVQNMGTAVPAAPTQVPVATTVPATVEPVAGHGRKLDVAWQQAVIDDLLSAPSFAEARNKLTRMKSEFKIKKYGVPAACSDADAAFWLIGDSAGKVVTVLGPLQGGSRTDFRSLSTGTLTAYKNYDSMWFILSK